MVLAGLLLAAMPAQAVKLTSGTFWLEGKVHRVSCGVTYRGKEPTQVKIQIFNFATPLLDPPGELELSPDNPASAWRTGGCPEDGCSSPWCQVTTTESKKQFRATMCVETETADGFEPVACIPVQ